MMKLKFVFIVLVYSFLVFTCGEKNDSVIGSRFHDIKKIEPTMPELLANGLSTTDIKVTVTDRNGELVDSLKILFSTTYGSIDELDYTNSLGEASTVLKSEASTTDLITTITATVVDTADHSLNKSNLGPFDVELSLPNFEDSSRPNLKKSSQSASNTASIEIKFLGITPSIEMNDKVLPADGQSETKVIVKLRETTSQKAVSNEEVYISAKYGTILGSAFTNNKGIVETKLTAAEKAGEDTLRVNYGDLLTASTTVTYTTPNLQLVPDEARIPADGNSKIEMVAILTTHKNTPIVGAEVKFSASAGIIPEKAFTDDFGQAKVDFKAGTVADSAVLIVAEFLSIADTATIAFVSTESGYLSFETDNEPILRDGISTKSLTLTANVMGQPLANSVINLGVDLGTVPETIITNENGVAVFEYTSDAGTLDAIANITASIGSIETTTQVNLLGVSFTVSAVPDSIPADGSSTSQIRVEAKQTTSQIAISDYSVAFAADNGTIATSAVTSKDGVAEATFTASREPGDANINITFGELTKSTRVYLFDNFANSINLFANPNYIWVKETGNLEQTIISAEVLGVTGELVGDNIGVKFRIINSPSGGEFIEPSDGPGLESQVIRTVDGKAEAKIRAGTKSGVVQIRAELVDYPNVAAQTTNIVIRSGPAYMWIDPSDPNHVIQHGSVLVEPCKFNVAFGNPVQDIKVTALFGDKYNNPIEKGTAVYFTTTGGIVTSDAVTNEKGQAVVILQNSNPFPYLDTEDKNQLTSCCIPNPNDESVNLDIPIPDFEGGLITNTMGSTDENDGVAVVLVYTWGQDQNGNDVKVWAYARLVYSRGIAYNGFYIESAPTSLAVGQSGVIIIRVFDVHGNPVAAGSSLTASTTAGELSETSLMPSCDGWGWGYTRFSTVLTNNLDPETDKTKGAVVTISLDSPNGSGKLSVPVLLQVGGL